MKIFLFVFIFLFSKQSFSEELVNKSASMALRGLMTVASMFNDIEEKMGENWGTAFALFVFLLLIVVMQSRNTLLLQQKLPIGKSHAL